jgi:hypothetical protein
VVVVTVSPDFEALACLTSVVTLMSTAGLIRRLAGVASPLDSPLDSASLASDSVCEDSEFSRLSGDLDLWALSFFGILIEWLE